MIEVLRSEGKVATYRIVREIRMIFSNVAKYYIGLSISEAPEFLTLNPSSQATEILDTCHSYSFQ